MQIYLKYFGLMWSFDGSLEGPGRIFKVPWDMTIGTIVLVKDL